MGQTDTGKGRAGQWATGNEFTEIDADSDQNILAKSVSAERIPALEYLSVACLWEVWAMLRKQLVKQFNEAVKKANLSEHREALLADARECIHLHYGKPVKKLPLGASRVGGTPDLPDSVDWPDGMSEGKPLGKAQFLAQFDLAELPDVEGLGLPHKGHLWIFVCDTSLCHLPVVVIHRDGSEPLSPRKRPKQEESPVYGWRDLKMVPLKFSVGISLPFSSKLFDRKWQSDSIASDGLHKLQEALGGDLDSYGPRDGIDGQIGGYSYQAENDLCREIAIEQLGKPDYIFADAWESVAQLEKQIARGSPFIMANKENYLKHLRAKLPQVKWIEENESRIAAFAASMHLLCMFRPSMEIGLEFGDGMFLDFLIQDSALAERDFSNVHCRLPMLL